MKYLYVFLAFFFLMHTLTAQTVWETQDIKLRYGIKGMYYDSVSEKSYIHGFVPLYIDESGDTTNIVIYDGVNFSAMSDCPVWDIRAMVRYKDKLFAGGGGLSSLASWNGTVWEVIEHEGLLFNLRVIDDRLYAVGNFEQIAGVPCRGIAVWNDTTWAAYKGLDSILEVSEALNDILYYKGKPYVCGNFFNPDYPELKDLMMYEEELGWQPVGDFTIGGLGGLEQMLVWRDTLYIAGLMGESSGAPGNCVAAWDGENWHRLQNGVGRPDEGSSAVREMTIYNNELWATGHFDHINGWILSEDQGSVAKWDGTRWCGVDFRRTGNSGGFGMWKDELFVVGEFFMADDTSAWRIAKWVGGDYTDTCVQDLTTAVESIDAAGLMFDVYPNPTNGEFTLTFQNDGIIRNGMVMTIQILDTYGRVVLSEKREVASGANAISLNAVNLSSGIYYLTSSLRDTLLFSKITKL